MARITKCRQTLQRGQRTTCECRAGVEEGLPRLRRRSWTCKLVGCWTKSMPCICRTTRSSSSRRIMGTASGNGATGAKAEQLYEIDARVRRSSCGIRTIDTVGSLDERFSGVGGPVQVRHRRRAHLPFGRHMYQWLEGRSWRSIVETGQGATPTRSPSCRSATGRNTATRRRTTAAGEATSGTGWREGPKPR